MGADRRRGRAYFVPISLHAGGMPYRGLIGCASRLRHALKDSIIPLGRLGCEVERGGWRNETGEDAANRGAEM